MIYLEEGDELYLVMDLMDTDLHKVIQSSQTLSESHHKFFLHQLLRGVKYMHDHRILHRDLKPGNLLVTKNCTLKIADFGLARKMPETVAKVVASGRRRPPMTDHVVTRWYRPPELMLQPDGYYNGAVDMWSIGCIFAEMLGRKPLFPGKNFVDQLTLIFSLIGTPSAGEIEKVKSSQAQRFLRAMNKKKRVPLFTVFPNASSEAIDLLDRMLQFNPKQRITVDGALKHPYMQKLEKRYKVKVSPTEFDFSFDLKDFDKEKLKELILNEVAPTKIETIKKERPSTASATRKKSNLPERATSAPRRRKISLKPAIPQFDSQKPASILNPVLGSEPKHHSPKKVQQEVEKPKEQPVQSTLKKNMSCVDIDSRLEVDVKKLYGKSTSNLHEAAGSAVHMIRQKQKAWAGPDPKQSTKPRPARKLTVPVSPKFSVMSWQKKTPPGGFVNRKRAATASGRLRSAK